MDANDSPLIIAAVARAVRLSTRHAWLVIPGFLIAAVLAGLYLSRHIAIDTDSSKLLSSSLPWRQQEMRLNELFPQQTDRIIAVVDATTPEGAEEAVAALADALAPQSDVIRTVTRPDGGEFFARNGILFKSLDDVRSDMAQLIKAEPFLGTLAADPTLHGVLGAISQSIEGVRLGKTTLEGMKPAVAAIADALDDVAEGKHHAFSRRRLITGHPPEPSELRRFINIQPVLNYGDLQPGGRATRAIRATVEKLGLTPDKGVRVRLTGSVALADEEFATVADGAALNGVVTILVVLLLLWLALKQARIVFAVLLNLAVGLTLTAAIGLIDGRRVQPDLGCVRGAVCRPRRRFRHPVRGPLPRRTACEPRSPPGASASTARGKSPGHWLLAAASMATALGFSAFLPTAYRGLAGARRDCRTGMIIAFLTTITLLPALLAVQAARRAAPMGWAALAPVDRFLERRRVAVVGLTLTGVILGLPLLRNLSFDFNPLDLRSKQAELVSTLLDLIADPDTSPNTIDILKPDLASASVLAEALGQLPEVAKARGRSKASAPSGPG